MSQYLMTDPRVLGIVGWVGTVTGGVSLIVTVAGFWIAIAQLRRVKRSAEASQAAVSKMAKVVQDREQSARLTHAVSQLRIARTCLAFNPGAAGAYVDTSCISLVEARVLAPSEEDKQKISRHLVRLRQIGEDLAPHYPSAISQAKLKSFGMVIQDAASDMGVIIARLRYNFDLEKHS